MIDWVSTSLSRPAMVIKASAEIWFAKVLSRAHNDQSVTASDPNCLLAVWLEGRGWFLSEALRIGWSWMRKLHSLEVATEVTCHIPQVISYTCSGIRITEWSLSGHFSSWRYIGDSFSQGWWAEGHTLLGVAKLSRYLYYAPQHYCPAGGAIA